MVTVLRVIYDNQYEEVRRAGCSLFSYAIINNKEVQQFSHKLGALNLMHQFVKETNILNRESVFGCIASFLKGDYFEGKRDFIDNLSGLGFLREAFLVS